MNHKQSGFTIIEVLGAIIAVVAFAGVAAVGYMAIKQGSADNANKSQNTSEKQVVQRGKTYFEFPDLGMKFEKTNSNKGMSFTSSKEANGVYLAHDETLHKLAKECYNEDRDVSFSAIRRNEGYSSSAGNAAVIKQFDTFGIAMNVDDSVQPCTDVAKQEQFASRITDLQKQLRYSIQGAEKL